MASETKTPLKVASKDTIEREKDRWITILMIVSTIVIVIMGLLMVYALFLATLNHGSLPLH